ncbi:spore coat protein [Ectobacillus ponti]|uniref:Spore coat protein n=1 Tax=Ectobacillus ponti TaxID=2961894 RepID=A0AA41XAI0_9BACI|nr:spore coat protein [Ectobacillus ponti]MCP8969278.1 spore coat protein [Ectobacillus ponti]
MTNLLQKIAGMGSMTDQVIASDFLITAKSGVRNLAFAVTEVGNPELKAVLRQQLRDAVATHETISKYMEAKGYYHPYDPNEQLQVNLQAAETAILLAD